MLPADRSKLDIFSWGCVLAEGATGEGLFPTNLIRCEIKAGLTNGTLQPTMAKSKQMLLTTGFFRLTQRCWQVYNNDELAFNTRPSAAEIDRELSDVDAIFVRTTEHQI